jgi:RNA polymerase sigma factor (sigma-70 family)
VSPRFFTPTLLLRKSDADLAALVTQGHEAAFDAIVIRHRGYLLRHCRRMLRDQRAEDAVQQTFVRALGALRSGTEVHELRPWLSRIARNVALDEVAARGGDYAELDEEWEDHVRSGEYERRASLREALRAVAALPDRQRTALLRSAAGDSPAVIAQELGVTSVAARQLLHRARVSVRAAVRVISPPPVIWLSRRLALASETIPRVAGAPAGAAPLASKIAVAVVASATVAAPVTVIHSVLSHHRRAPHRHALASRPHPAGRPIQPRITVAAVSPAPPPQPVVPVPRPRPVRAAQPAPRVRRTRPAPRAAAPTHTATASSQSAGVSATASGAPVGSGSSPEATSASPVAADASAAGPAGSSSSDSGPMSSATASAPTQTTDSATSSSGDASSSAASSGDSSAPATGP